MATFSGFTEREIPLSVPRLRAEWEEFLRSRGLEPIAAPECVAGLYDGDDRLAATASLVRSSSGFVLQGVAVSQDLEEGGLLPRLIQYLQGKAAELSGEARPNLLLYTKPEYAPKFRSLAFREVGRAPKAVLLESDRHGIDAYLRHLGKERRQGRNGVIVMNANPFTLGHRYLVEQAAAQVDNLYVIPVLDDTPDGFSYGLRRRAIVSGTEDMENVHVLHGSRYAVSAATFPTYFIKSVEERTDTHIALDLDIFARHIAPALGATVRFVGSEPTDPLTARYNELMHERLPQKDIEVREIERRELGDEPISASKVRKLLADKDFVSASELLPATTTAVLLADKAVQALQAELDLDPKPGLVTPTSNGAHADMDYSSMSAAIEALRPSFEAFALIQLIGQYAHPALVQLGLQAEDAMMRASGGVNTHRGAIFALGLMVSAAAHASVTADRFSAANSNDNHQRNTDARAVRPYIQALAKAFVHTEGTHGAKAREKGGLRSALDMAQAGYPELFSDWLPFYRNLPQQDPHRLHKTLLRIISTLDDTNIAHRGGIEALDRAKAEAQALLADFSANAYEQFCADMTGRRLSPGGAADMLALTLLTDSLTD